MRDLVTLFFHVIVDVVRDSFNVLRLVDLQRQRVSLLKRQAEARLTETRAQVDLFRTADLSKFDFGELGKKVAILNDNPELLEMVRSLATGVMPQLSVKSRIARYNSYLKYLDELEYMYSEQLQVVDIELFRRRVAGQGG